MIIKVTILFAINNQRPHNLSSLYRNVEVINKAIQRNTKSMNFESTITSDFKIQRGGTQRLAHTKWHWDDQRHEEPAHCAVHNMTVVLTPLFVSSFESPKWFTIKIKTAYNCLFISKQILSSIYHFFSREFISFATFAFSCASFQVEAVQVHLWERNRHVCVS